jgi:regulator of cell morphogenesis and NO signaling
MSHRYAAHALPTTIGAAPLTEERATALLAAFDRIAPGERLVVGGEGDPQDLLELLQSRRKGLFEWCGAVSSWSGWRVEIVRRKAALGSLRRVGEVLTSEHDRLDAAAATAFAAVRAGGSEIALRQLAVFRRSLERHLCFEEEVLLPVFEVRTGLPHGGPTSLIRTEHQQMRGLLDEIAQRLAGRREALEEIERLQTTIRDHHRKEELILYPWIDRLLTEAEADRLVARIQAFPY